jgi:hypothetical protein
LRLENAMSLFLMVITATSACRRAALRNKEDCEFDNRAGQRKSEFGCAAFQACATDRSTQGLAPAAGPGRAEPFSAFFLGIIAQ